MGSSSPNLGGENSKNMWVAATGLVEFRTGLVPWLLGNVVFHMS